MPNLGELEIEISFLFFNLLVMGFICIVIVGIMEVVRR